MIFLLKILKPYLPISTYALLFTLYNHFYFRILPKLGIYVFSIYVGIIVILIILNPEFILTSILNQILKNSHYHWNTNVNSIANINQNEVNTIINNNAFNLYYTGRKDPFELPLEHKGRKDFVNRLEYHDGRWRIRPIREDYIHRKTATIADIDWIRRLRYIFMSRLDIIREEWVLSHYKQVKVLFSDVIDDFLEIDKIQKAIPRAYSVYRRAHELNPKNCQTELANYVSLVQSLKSKSKAWDIFKEERLQQMGKLISEIAKEYSELPAVQPYIQEYALQFLDTKNYTVAEYIGRHYTPEECLILARLSFVIQMEVDLLMYLQKSLYWLVQHRLLANYYATHEKVRFVLNATYEFQFYTKRYSVGSELGWLPPVSAPYVSDDPHPGDVLRRDFGGYDLDEESFLLISLLHPFSKKIEEILNNIYKLIDDDLFFPITNINWNKIPFLFIKIEKTNIDESRIFFGCHLFETNIKMSSDTKLFLKNYYSACLNPFAVTKFQTAGTFSLNYLNTEQLGILLFFLAGGTSLDLQIFFNMPILQKIFIQTLYNKDFTSSFVNLNYYTIIHNIFNFNMKTSVGADSKWLEYSMNIPLTQINISQCRVSQDSLKLSKSPNKIYYFP